MITLTGEQLAPVKLIHRLQCIVITLPDEEIGLRCLLATCHYVTLMYNYVLFKVAISQNCCLLLLYYHSFIC